MTGRARLEDVVAALTDCEVCRARIRNYALAMANTHGLDAADSAIAAAQSDVDQLRADLAAEAGGGR